jgi:ribonuclease E
VLVHLDPADDSRKKNGSGNGDGEQAAGGRGRRGRRGAVAEAGPPSPALLAARGPSAASPDEVDVASEDHRTGDEAVDTVEAVEPEADVTVTTPDPAQSRDAAAPVESIAPAALAEGAATEAGTPAPARRSRRRRVQAPAGSPGAVDPTVTEPAPVAGSNGVGPLESVATGTGTSAAPEATVTPDSPVVPEATVTPDSAAPPDRPGSSEPVAGSNGVVGPGPDPAGQHGTEPVAGSNGTVNGSAAPRRRRRAASRPAGPPQPVSTD